jgi:diacylglycerol kinase (ATP)
MRLALLANTASGTSTDEERLAACLREAGAEVAVHDVREAAPLGMPSSQAPDGLEGDPDRLVVAGGDGSLGPAAVLAQRLAVALAVVPTGTANDFARALGLPRELGEACRLAADPQAATREVEVGSAGGRPFLNAASAGLSVAAAEAAHPLKARLGPLAYPLGAAWAAVREEPLHLRVRVDGEERFAGDAWQVVVAATGHFGGGSAIGGTTSDDGRLDVAVVPAGSRLGLAWRAAGMVTRVLVRQRAVQHLRGDAIEVDGVPAFNVDGERCSVEPPRFTTAGRVQVVVP